MQQSDDAAQDENQPDAPLSTEAIARLVAGHRDFLAFLEKRVGNRATAEELLQAAFVRALEKGQTLRESESLVAWFYRLLRNALVDHYRHAAVEGRANAQHAQQAETFSEPELRDAICHCMKTLLPNLKPEYAALIEQVDLNDQSLGSVAQRLSISTNNATVRLHRARQALKRQLERSCGTCATHGCIDCTCARGCHTSIDSPSK